MSFKFSYKQRSDIILAISLLLIFLWTYVVYSKLSDTKIFMEQLSRQPLPDWSLNIMVWALPLIEAIAALLLLFKASREFGLMVSMLLMFLFTVYVSLALSGSFGEIPCSCGGIFKFLKWKGHFVFNIVFTAMAFTGWRLQVKQANQ